MIPTARRIVSEEWARAVEEFELRPGNIAETVVARIINRLDQELTSDISLHVYSPDIQAQGDCRICGHQQNTPWHRYTLYRIDHDDFEGQVIGDYKTREGKHGVVLQQVDTRVVHVYGAQWLGTRR